MNNQCCGTCRYYYRDKTMLPGDHVCVNDQSEYVTDYVERDHVCPDWEAKSAVEEK